MNDATMLGFRFADAVVRRSTDDDEFRDAVTAQWGPKGVIDLTMALQLGRMFPMVKAGLPSVNASSISSKATEEINTPAPTAITIEMTRCKAPA